VRSFALRAGGRGEGVVAFLAVPAPAASDFLTLVGAACVVVGRVAFGRLELLRVRDEVPFGVTGVPRLVEEVLRVAGAGVAVEVARAEG
jgi:hypothetical protein